MTINTAVWLILKTFFLLLLANLIEIKFIIREFLDKSLVIPQFFHFLLFIHSFTQQTFMGIFVVHRMGQDAGKVMFSCSGRQKGRQPCARRNWSWGESVYLALCQEARRFGLRLGMLVGDYGAPKSERTTGIEHHLCKGTELQLGRHSAGFKIWAWFSSPFSLFPSIPPSFTPSFNPPFLFSFPPFLSPTFPLPLSLPPFSFSLPSSLSSSWLEQ